MNLKREGANHGILEDLDNRNDNWGTLEQELDERYTKTESDTRFAPKQHTHEISDVNGLSDELERSGLTLVNLIENGDFSDGTSRWYTSNSTMSSSNNAITSIGDGTLQYPQIAQLIPNLAEGVLYCVFDFKKENTNVVNVAVSHTTFRQSFDSVNVYNLALGEWKKISYYNKDKPFDTRIRIYHQYDNVAQADGSSVSFKNIRLLNLTETFAQATNPPNKKWTYSWKS